jgi:8-oxo-dGTP pyrophosphatase MutT (NUDIX family)
MNERRATILSEEEVYRGRIIRIARDRVRFPHGAEVIMEIVRHPGSVVLIPKPSPTQIVLVRQYRHPIGRWLWELPAGILNPGENPEHGARRECEEEIGLTPARVERVATLYATPGYCDEVMMFFQLEDLRPAGPGAEQDQGEHLEPRIVSLDEARAMVASGEIADMKTVLGLGYAGR